MTEFKPSISYELDKLRADRDHIRYSREDLFKWTVDIHNMVNNELGKINIINVRVRWCRPQRYYDLSDWRGTYSHDGGALTNQGIHHIDLLRYLCGEIDEVNCKMSALGAKIKVEAGTQSGKILRLKGKGLPSVNGYGRGDQLVKINVFTPTKLSSDEKALLEKLRDADNFKPRPGQTDKSFFGRMKEFFG